MKKVLCLVLLLSGCALFETDKTPLTPQGQMNVCIRDEVLAYKNNGKIQSLGEWGAAQKIADDCTRKYNLSVMYTQAVNNARDMIHNNSEGITLRRW